MARTVWNRPSRRLRFRNSRPAPYRPGLEPLEGRALPSAVTEMFVTRLYRDVLQRDADPAGRAAAVALLDRGQVSRGTLALALESSPEHRMLQVQQVYSLLLRRAADPGGLSNAAVFLAAGGTVEQLTAAVAGSDEYFATQCRASNEGFVDAVFRDVLGRRPMIDCSMDISPLACMVGLDQLGGADPAGRAAFTGVLAAGVTRTQVAAAVQASDEYRQNLVDASYQRFLRRDADPVGRAAFLGLVQRGASDEVVAAAFLGSDEYLAGE
jgi:hypothetical protein